MKKIIISIFVLANSLCVYSGEVNREADWHKYDKNYSYQEHSPLGAGAISLLPFWSGSFATGANVEGIFYVFGKTVGAASIANILITDNINWVTAAGAILYPFFTYWDVKYSYKTVWFYNADFAYEHMNDMHTASAVTSDPRNKNRIHERYYSFSVSSNF